MQKLDYTYFYKKQFYKKISLRIAELKRFNPAECIIFYRLSEKNARKFQPYFRHLAKKTLARLIGIIQRE